jgi:hypothetical protein
MIVGVCGPREIIMTRLVTTGFEVPNYFYPFSIHQSTTPLFSSTCKSGNYALCVQGNPADRILYTMPAGTTEVYYKWFIRLNNLKTTDSYTDFIHQYYNHSTGWPLDIGVRDNRFYVSSSSGWTGEIRRFSSKIISANTWYLMEVYFKLATSGLIQLYLDSELQGQYSGNTKGSATQLTDLVLGYWSTINQECFFDDVMINDTSGNSDNSLVGNSRIFAMRPNAAGSKTEWTPLSGNNYENVDEVVVDDDTTYVSTDTNNEVDLYNVESPSLPTSLSGWEVKRVWTEAIAKTDSADTDAISVGVKSGESENWGSSIALTTTYAAYPGNVLTTNPADDEAWETDDLTNIEIGIKATTI